MKSTNKKFKIQVRIGLIFIALISIMAIMLPDLLARASAAEHEVVGGNYFLSDYDTVDEVVAAGQALNTELVSEGTVLLKNADDALPLVTEKKISLFGKNLFGRMGGLVGALRNVGFEVNGMLSNFYNNNELSGTTGAPGHPGNGVVISGLPTGEADIARFNDTTNSIDEFNDAAIVAFYRTSGEGFDLPRTMGMVNGNYKEFGPNIQPVTGARAVDDHQLQLDKNEAGLLAYCAENFDKVIVILNSPAPIELGFLDDPDHYAYHEEIKGALWTDAFNTESWPAIARILTGEVNPSGRLPDTYARDFKADPSWNNFGNNFMEDYIDGGSTVYAKGNQYANEIMRGAGGNGGGGYYSNYVYYKEGIYSAYRYWETRGYTEGSDKWTGETTDTLSRYAHGPNEAIHYYSKLGTDSAKQVALDGKEWDSWYDAHVVYPFGYGLSYTDFTWEFVDPSATVTPDGNGNITVDVKVTNTGGKAGKDVVQLYYSAPYNDEAESAIQKSHVQLGAFGKTRMLEPDDSQTLRLTLKVRDMASYDWSDANGNGFKGYELEAGTYNIYIGKNAHSWAEPDVLTKVYNLTAGVTYETDEATGNNIENRFDAVSEQLLHEDRYPEDSANNEKDMYMTRSNWVDTYPTLSYRLTAEQWIIDGLKEYNDVGEAPFGTVYPADKVTDPWYNDVMPKLGQKYETPVKLKELFRLEYDDELWDTFLDQLTLAQLNEIVLRGSYKSGTAIPELGVTLVVNHDTPTQVLIPGASKNVYLPNDILTAATWNEEIAYRRGKIFGNISMWGDGDMASRVVGWYAPAVNVHRNPFGGRVGEYLSEDGFLAGKISAQIVIGAQEKGMFCYVKHFAVNSQETNRCGLLTWADEQTMREIYFKPFEICVKEGKTLGIMSALNRFGPRWTGGSYELLTNVLRDEWGFRGSVVTDSFASWSNADIMIRAGGSLALGYAPNLKVAPSSATSINALRNCAHDILYTHANSMAINEGETPTIPKKMRSFVAKTLDIGMVNTDYEQSIAGCVSLNTEYYPDLDAGKVKFALADTSVLPGGLTLSENGTISGKPTMAARLSFTVIATYENESLARTFTVTIVGEGGAIIYDTGENVFTAYVNSPFAGDVAKARIYDPYASEADAANFPDITYSVANGSQLPEGLTLKTDGTLVGTPSKECKDYSFSVVASALGYRDTDFGFTISVLYPLSYGAKPLADGSYGKSYMAAINTAVCDASVTYTLKSGSTLPKGLKLSGGGYIAGVPEEACSKTFTVIASSKYAAPVEAEYTLTINPIFDSTTELPYGKIGEAYLGSVGTAQGSFGITYTIVGGSLPAGLEFKSDGSIKGTPGAPGTYTIIVRAEDGDLYDEIVLNLFVDIDGSVKPGNNRSTDAYMPAAVTLGITTGVFAAGFIVMTVLFVLLKKKDN